MSWFVVDDQLFQNLKFQALLRRELEGDPDAGLAGLLWTMAGSRLKAGLKDGTVDRFDLGQLVPDPERAAAAARVLVEVGLWHDHEHCCERCQRPRQGEWLFHDWRVYYKRTGAEERLARALQTERKDARLRQAVWERDRLPKASQDAPDTARCVYCQDVLSRSTRGGDKAPEIEHVYARPMGVDGLAISCRKCNRDKGQRSYQDAGLKFHPTSAHAEALARRPEKFSPPDGAAGMLEEPAEAAYVPPVGGAADDEPCSPPEGAAGREWAGSPPAGVAESARDVIGASSAPPGGSSAPAERREDAQEPQEREKRAPEGGGSSLPISGSPSGADGLAAPDLGPYEPGYASNTTIELDAAAESFLMAALGLAGASRAHGRTHPHPPARTGALPGARAVAGQGRAGQGGEGQGPAGDGTAGQGSRHRHRRRSRTRRKEGPR